MSDNTVEQRKTLIIATVGDVITTQYPTGILLENIDLIWNNYDYVEDTDTALHDLLIKRDAILMVMGASRSFVDVRIAGDSEVKSGQLMDRLEFMLDQVTKALGAANGSFGAMSATQILSVTPDSPPSWWIYPDANNPQYGGDPYRRTVRK